MICRRKASEVLIPIYSNTRSDEFGHLVLFFFLRNGLFTQWFDREKPGVLKSVLREKKKDFYCPFILE